MAYRLPLLEKFLSKPEPYKCETCPYCNGERDPTVKYPKPAPWVWWNETLKSPKTVVAPMVDQSELPFRMLCRKYGADLAYTPMFNSKIFADDANYRKNQWSTCPEDRPLFVQFCGHDADTVLAAARHVENDCDAVDLNLGCPQGIAKKGHYGSFLMEHWDVIHTILHTLSVELKIPVVAKMRIFDDLPLTLRYARMLRDTGIHTLAVHGRTREMKGQQTGIAKLDYIAAVKREITTIPVIYNGNIQRHSDLAPNFEATKCDAAMSAECLLWDPRVFANPTNPILTGRSFQVDKATRLDAIAVVKEYLDLAEKYWTPFANVKSHVFKLLHHSLECCPEFRQILGDMPATKPNMPRLREIVAALEQADLKDGPDGVYTKRVKVKREKTNESGAAATEGGGEEEVQQQPRPEQPPAERDVAASAAPGGD